jgi:hypothetical protein
MNLLEGQKTVNNNTRHESKIFRINDPKNERCAKLKSEDDKNRFTKPIGDSTKTHSALSTFQHLQTCDRWLVQAFLLYSYNRLEFAGPIHNFKRICMFAAKRQNYKLL